MFNFLKTKPFLPQETVDWEFACFRWLLQHSGGIDRLVKTRLVQPTDEFFPITPTTPEQTAQGLFEAVRWHAGLENWPCHLEAQQRDPDPHLAATLLVQQAPFSPAGTFQRTQEGAKITYNPANVSDPMSLVATFAHELAHFFTCGFSSPPPGGWDEWEDATDLASVFLGFGVFACNSCFSFKQFSDGITQGWSMKRQGYLSEKELLFALAIFATLQDLPRKGVVPGLKRSLRSQYTKAEKLVRTCPEQLESLRAVRGEG